MSLDLQNAYESSRRERYGANSDALRMIARLLSSGRFVVVVSVPAFCRHTDAILGEDLAIHSDHATREEADAEVEALVAKWGTCDGDLSFEVKPVAPRSWPVALPVSVDDDIPF